MHPMQFHFPCITEGISSRCMRHANTSAPRYLHQCIDSAVDVLNFAVYIVLVPTVYISQWFASCLNRNTYGFTLGQDEFESTTSTIAKFGRTPASGDSGRSRFCCFLAF